jgi:TPR repeat protein
MGVLCLNGWGMTQDYAAAMKWFAKVADNQYAQTLKDIGLLCIAPVTAFGRTTRTR